MAIYHIVMFKFKALLPLEEVQTLCDEMLALGEKCLHPTTNAPYVKTLGGGKDSSPEGLQGGITHCFVSKFENEEDRKYYLETDPAHREFVTLVKDKVDKVQVIDFTPGSF
ncbi:putative stress responsive A B Barrel domain-containing protein [Rosellinia necatrix]|uniref:Putative stress responsive A B Barrel domain-containing protein n=1 Tax=Rosellinia necatrix TaxID=77044 RepID=A0A1S7UNM8_ROSNE|nr:putative stress responsive A B Barrel domain-containing protein [Rosellinia necatrix]